MMHQDWIPLIKGEFSKKYLKSLSKEVQKDRKIHLVYPEQESVFKCFELSPNDINVVIIGQSPYHDGKATGLAFATEDQMTPSLNHIFKALEKEEETGLVPFRPRPYAPEFSCCMTDLMDWVEQGVFLLNRSLTVKHGKPNSHLGWHRFTKTVIAQLSAYRQKLVFILLGKTALKVSDVIDLKKHLILTAEHPATASYQNREWRYKDVFSKCNQFLIDNDKPPIIW